MQRPCAGAGRTSGTGMMPAPDGVLHPRMADAGVPARFAVRHALQHCLALLVLLCTVLLPVPGWSQDIAIPQLSGRVLDRTATLNAEQQRQLTEKLAALEQESGAQIAVLIVPTTGDDSIEQYAVRAFETWKLGRKDVDDGILVVVAKDDRAMRIEVGYGLEGVVTDTRASRIIREQMAPRFAQGDFAGGLHGAVEQLALLVRTGELPAPQGQPSGESSDSSGESWGVGLLESLVLLVILVFKAVPGPIAGVAIFFLTGSIWLGIGAAVLVMVLNRLLHRVQGTAVRRGGSSRGGFSSGSWGGRSSGSSRGGGFRGGGGRSGGGGASGRW